MATFKETANLARNIFKVYSNKNNLKNIDIKEMENIILTGLTLCDCIDSLNQYNTELKNILKEVINALEV